MSDQVFLLDQLTPVEALLLLSETIAGANYTNFRVEVGESVFGATATLILPNDAKNDTVKTIVAAYAALKGGEPSKMADRGEGLPLSKGITRLLLSSLGDETEAAEPAFPEQFMLIGRDLDETRAATLFEDLRFHATHTRIATAGTTDHPVFLFHVLDDQDRKSSFLSLEAGDNLEGMTPLIGYPCKDYTVFLPRTPKPSGRALEAFTALITGSPDLIGRATTAPDGLLLAVNPEPSPTTTGYHSYYLGALSFYGQAHFVPQTAHRSDFALHDLADSPAMVQRLRRAVEEAAPDIGYRLELRRVKQGDGAETARMRLLERQTEIAYQLAYLDSVSRPRPMLLRFTEQQLPALAAMIRAFPLEVLRLGYPKYGFQAREVPPGAPGAAADAAGLHYLYLEPEDAVLQELDPLLPYGSGPDAPQRFWLDPFWARYYHGPENATLVFVPQQSALFPPMHSWSAAEMDDYLREVIGTWFGPEQTMPGQPIYVFEGQPQPDQPITLSVLDFDAFVPLHTRLGWLNDHLHLGQDLKLEHFIGAMAADATRSQLAKDIAEDARKSEETLEELLLSTNRVTSRKLSELSETVSLELNNVLEQTHQTADYLKELYDYLQELTLLGRGAEAATGQAFRGLVKTEGRYRDLTRFISKLEHDIEQELHQADMARHKMANKVKRSVDELGTTHEMLREKLLEIIRIRK